MAPIKQKYIRGNKSSFMNQDIHKAKMTRKKLKNRFLKEATLMNRLAYKKQRNYSRTCYNGHLYKAATLPKRPC